MVNHYATMAGVPSQHGNPPHGFRPAADEWDPVEEILKTRGIVPGTFLRACLRWLASDPDAALTALAGHWPDPRPLGRPRGKAARKKAIPGDRGEPG
jgi:hypothetical protein